MPIELKDVSFTVLIIIMTALAYYFSKDLVFSFFCMIFFGISYVEAEIGKGFFLLEKYQNHQNASNTEWNSLTMRNAHTNKIRHAQRMIGTTDSNQTTELNNIKLRDLYVDWDRGWRSPMDLQQTAIMQRSTNLLDLARSLLVEFERRF